MQPIELTVNGKRSSLEVEPRFLLTEPWFGYRFALEEPPAE